MDDKIDKAIENAVNLVQTNVHEDKAMKYSQAALNLAHTKSILHGIEIQRALHEEQKKKPVGAK